MLHFYRDPEDFLDPDRKLLLQKNREEIKQKLNIKGEMILDILLETKVITSRNKEDIEVLNQSFKLIYYYYLFI